MYTYITECFRSNGGCLNVFECLFVYFAITLLAWRTHIGQSFSTAKHNTHGMHMKLWNYRLLPVITKLWILMVFFVCLPAPTEWTRTCLFWGFPLPNEVINHLWTSATWPRTRLVINPMSSFHQMRTIAERSNTHTRSIQIQFTLNALKIFFNSIEFITSSVYVNNKLCSSLIP